jgi:membrane protease YdiL (CAAX protease family)
LENLICSNCNLQNLDSAKFCKNCGKKLFVVELENHKPYLIRFLVSFFVITFYILALNFIPVSSNDYIVSISIDIIFFIIVSILTIVFFKYSKGIFSFKTFKFKKLLFYSSIQIGITLLCFSGIYILKKSFDIEKNNYIVNYLTSPNPLLFATISIAIFPAITEEIAFRGILFGQLTKLISNNSSIFVTGFIFALVHFNFLSFFWLIPAGIFYGWMREREGIIWYGTILHFLHNFSVIFIEYISL